MPQDVTCPKCNNVFPVMPDHKQIGVDCPRCEAALTVTFKKRPAPVDPGLSPFETFVKPGKPASVDSPLASARKKRRSEDDEDEGPAKGGSMGLVYVAAIGASLIALGGLGGTGYLLFTNLDTSNSSYSRINKPANQNNSSGQPNKPSNDPNNRASLKGQFNLPRPANNPQPGTPPRDPARTEPFQLSPVSGPLPEISPPPIDLSSALKIDLPSKVANVGVGGGGRYLVLHMPEAAKLGVLDAATGQVNLVDGDRGKVELAAGLSKVVVLANDANATRVYSLPDLKKQYDGAVPVSGLRTIAMGSRTNGPVVGIGFGKVQLMTLAADGSLKEEPAGRKEGLAIHSNAIRATPDGRCYLTIDNFDHSGKVRMITEENKQWVKRDLGQTPFPGNDSLLYGSGTVVDRNGVDQKFGGAGAGTGAWFLPAVSGNSGMFLKVVPAPAVRGKVPVTITVHADQDSQLLASGTSPFLGLSELDGLLNERGVFSRDRPLDHHLFLIPEANLLVTVSTDKTKLWMRKLK